MVPPRQEAALSRLKEQDLPQHAGALAAHLLRRCCSWLKPCGSLLPWLFRNFFCVLILNSEILKQGSGVWLGGGTGPGAQFSLSTAGRNGKPAGDPTRAKFREIFTMDCRASVY